MKYIPRVLRRIEWLVLFSYVVIVIVEVIVLRSLSGSPEANAIRYFTLFYVILLSIVVIRRQVVKPIQEMRAASIRFADGDYDERLPTYNNIELNELGQAFNQMAETIATSEQRRVELIGDVAHELRTPLNNIKITMEGLIDQVLEADQTTFFNVQHEVSRLQRLVSQLEMLSRAESDQIILNKQPVNLSILILDVVDRLGIQFEDKDVGLETAVSPKLPIISADLDKLTQILVNLLGNALQYTPPGGIVVISANNDNMNVSIAITDTGVGIAYDDLTRIFERFYRVDKSRARSSGGNGIGLTIAKHLVLAHDGRVWASSPGIDQGTTITFTLPLND